MSLTENSALKLDFRSKPLEPQLEPLCSRVLAEFKLPPLRLYCFFADADDQQLRQKFGKYYRGLHTIFRGNGDLPHYLMNCSIDWRGDIAFDNLIYITQQTTLDQTACVTTFAHELQHFVQYGFHKKVTAANSILYDQILRFDPGTARTPIDIPHEREANIVSKRIAEQVCGFEAVKAFAEEQVKQFAALAGQGDEVAASEKIRWEFFRDVPSSTEFDLLAETIPLVNKFRPQLIAERFGVRERIDFSQPEWWL